MGDSGVTSRGLYPLCTSTSERWWAQYPPSPERKLRKTHFPRKHTATCTQMLEMLAPGRDWPRQRPPSLHPAQDTATSWRCYTQSLPFPTNPLLWWLEIYGPEKGKITNGCSLLHSPKAMEHIHHRRKGCFRGDRRCYQDAAWHFPQPASPGTRRHRLLPPAPSLLILKKHQAQEKPDSAMNTCICPL